MTKIPSLQAQVLYKPPQPTPFPHSNPHISSLIYYSLKSLKSFSYSLKTSFFLSYTISSLFTEIMAPDITTVTTNAMAEQPKAADRAFVTFLAGNGDYVKGVVGLAKGLRKTKTIYPLVVAVLPDVPDEHRKILKSQGCIVREIEPVYPPENQTQFAMAYYVINYSKLRIWEVHVFYFFYFTIACLISLFWRSSVISHSFCVV